MEQDLLVSYFEISDYDSLKSKLVGVKTYLEFRDQGRVVISERNYLKMVRFLEFLEFLFEGMMVFDLPNIKFYIHETIKFPSPEEFISKVGSTKEFLEAMKVINSCIAEVKTQLVKFRIPPSYLWD